MGRSISPGAADRRSGWDAAKPDERNGGSGQRAGQNGNVAMGDFTFGICHERGRRAPRFLGNVEQVSQSEWKSVGTRGGGCDSSDAGRVSRKECRAAKTLT